MPNDKQPVDQDVALHVEVKDSVRRHIRSEAAKLGLTMGDYITSLLTTAGGYEPPVPVKAGK